MALNSNFTAGQVLTAAQQNNFPRGVAAVLSRTTAVSALTTVTTDLTGVSVTFTADSTRLYKFTFFVTGQKVTSAGYTDIQLTDNSNNVIMGITQYSIAGNYWNCSGGVTKTGLSGSVTYKLRGSTEIATSAPIASAVVPITLIVEDVGLA
jgi:hypothetical protein